MKASHKVNLRGILKTYSNDYFFNHLILRTS